MGYFFTLSFCFLNKGVFAVHLTLYPVWINAVLKTHLLVGQKASENKYLSVLWKSCCILFLLLYFQYQQRRQQENMQRQSRGEAPLPEEDINKLFKPPQPPARMESLLIAGNVPAGSFNHLFVYECYLGGKCSCYPRSHLNCSLPLTLWCGNLALIAFQMLFYLVKGSGFNKLIHSPGA